MSDAKQRHALLARFGAADPLDDPAAFVLLWTFFDTVGLSGVENSFVINNFDPNMIEPNPPRPDDESYSTERLRSALARKHRDLGFDHAAAAWLKGLDGVLTMQRGTFEHRVLEGYDGRTYRIRALNNVIGGYFAGLEREPDDEDIGPRGVAGNTRRSLSLSAYCSRFRVVPTELKGIRIIGTGKWGNPSIHDRLRAAARNGLRFLSWPVRYALGVHRWQDEKTKAKFVRVNVAADAAVRHAELARAVAAARDNAAAILVLPELSTASADLAVLQELLSKHAFDDCPILTVAGLEHQRGDAADVNEAVLLGPDGELLHRQAKLTRYPAADGSKEWTTTGTEMHVFESPVGNLTLLICLDLFNEGIEPVIDASHANVLLVPSLSDKTSAHASAARRYLNVKLATTVVCNRWFPARESEDDPGRKLSFTLLPGRFAKGGTMMIELGEGADFVLAIVE